MTAQPLQINSMTVKYGRLTAVDHVSLAVPEGAVYALLGRNGAGKSSLVRCLLGLQKATSGEALLFGTNAWKAGAKIMDRVGVVPEDGDAPPSMTPLDLERFFARIYSRWNRELVLERFKRFDVGLKTPFARLSKGQKRHVALALALGSSPDLLVLDDPTLGLDPVARKEFYDVLLAELADRGITVFLTTHDLAGIEGIASHVAIMNGAKLVVDEPLESLKQRFRKLRFPPVVELGHIDALSPVRVREAAWGTETEVSNFDEQKSFDPAVEITPMSLEEIFEAVVAGAER